MNVLVIGGTGFLGGVTASHLAAAGHRVTCTGQAEFGKEALKGFVKYKSFVLGRDNPRDLDPAIYDSAVIFPWISQPTDYLTSDKNEWFRLEIMKLVNQLFAMGIGGVALLGSCLEYAASDHRLTEESPTDPTKSRYVEAKIKLYEDLTGGPHPRSSEILWLRPFFPFGPGEANRKLVTSTVRALIADQQPIYSDLSANRDFIFVDDVGSAISHLVAKQLTGVFNIGTGIGTCVSKVVGLIYQSMGRHLGGVSVSNSGNSIVGNTDKLFAAGWVPRFTVEEGIDRTVSAILWSLNSDVRKIG